MVKDISSFRAVYHSSSADYDHTGHLVTVPAPIPWISSGLEKEWLLFDLGASSNIQRIDIQWGESSAFSVMVEVSEDKETWLNAAESVITHSETSRINSPATGRFVRLVLHTFPGKQIIIYQVHIYGENESVQLESFPDVSSENELSSDSSLSLSGKNWKVIRASEMSEDGCFLSAFSEKSQLEEKDCQIWLPAVVPGTVLNSFLLAGAVPNPFFDDDQFQVSEEYFTADFWYRKSFRIKQQNKKRVFLEFEKINWKADVYLNGTYLPNPISGRTHSIEGAFIRAQFDVTGVISYEKENILAVRIICNDSPGVVTTQGLAYGPGPNGGLLGADNPTLHASIGWDWLPTIRGRNTGILGDVSLHFCEDLQLCDPWMETKLELISESIVNPPENLMLRSSVKVDGYPGAIHDWHGKESDCFTVDFGSPVPISSVVLLWGTEACGRSADYESRFSEQFSLEVSKDGIAFCNLDAFPGGQVQVHREYRQQAQENAGTFAYSGHTFSDTLPGATAYVDLDPSFFGPEAGTHSFVQPQLVRFLRFTVLKQRELNGYPVDTIIKEIQVYGDSDKLLEQTTQHEYVLNKEHANLVLHTDIRNDSGAPVDITLSGRILLDGPVFSEKKTLPTDALTEASVSLSLDHPKLWWPNTYGEQYLYTCELELLVNGRTIDSKTFQFGVRRFDYPIENKMLTLCCNGERIVAKGGNWGMDDGLKRDTADVYYDKIRLHAEANMTMIRNWVGMTDHPAFYDACDRYGILIWDDFWLANPWDGPSPKDPDMFLQNAADKIRKIRSHPALAFYCGRNEGYPPEQIEQGLKLLTEQLDGTRIYFPNSSAEPVSSGGGYSLAKAEPEFGIKQYFNDVTSPALRSERGIPNVPELESVRKFVRPEHLWPISETWALHDWTYHANGPANSYMEALQNYLGGDFSVPVDNIKDWTPDADDPVYQEYQKAVTKMCMDAGKAWTVEDFFQAAQLINYDHHRGIFEALSARLSNGLLMWMSQSSWPSFMWQTYDYYLYTNGGYFGAKAGNQPVRAFFDSRKDTVLLANATPDSYTNLTVTEEIFNLYGQLVWKKEHKIQDLPKDAYGISVGTVDFSASDTDVLFLRLTLSDQDSIVLGQNTYWHNRKEYQNYRILRSIPKTRLSIRALESSEVKSRQNGRTMIRTKLLIQNGDYPSLNTRIRFLNQDQADILPVFFSDNYLLLMPHETRIIEAEYAPEKQTGDRRFTVTAWNIE